MIVSARTRANRRNALLSTGPRTTAGKRRASLNATTHGLSARNAATVPEEVLELARNLARVDGVVTPAAAAIVAAQAELDLRRVRRFRDGLAILASGAPTEELSPLLARALRLDRYERSAAARRNKAFAQLTCAGLPPAALARAMHTGSNDLDHEC